MKSKKALLKSLFAFVLAFLVVLMPITASAMQKQSNPDLYGEGVIDGVDADPDIGGHNSYVWCAEMFEQTDADYLWVGTNRDLGATIGNVATNGNNGELAGMFGSLGGDLAALADMFVPSDDKTGKIYRQKAADTDAEFELMYENPAINGYRRMIVFNDYLYVCAGLTNVSKDSNYAVVLRFSKDFKPDDKPEIVMWDKLPDKQQEYFRSACVYNGYLYIGTFDSKIYVTDGTGLTNLTPNTAGTGEKYTGWTLALDMNKPLASADTATADTAAATGAIWDMVGYKGSIYTVNVGGSGGVYGGNGAFLIYKLDPSEDGLISAVTPVIGPNESCDITSGFGIRQNAIGSPFVITVDGVEYLYVTTFANGPVFLMALIAGQVEYAMENLFQPAQIYRYSDEYGWEVVAGDTTGEYVAVDKEGNPLPVVGNSRAGFFPGVADAVNASANQYIWWMAQQADGTIYTTTWDTGVFAELGEYMVLMAFIKSYGMPATTALAMEAMPYIQNILAASQKLVNDSATKAADMQALAEQLLAGFVDYAKELKEKVGSWTKEDFEAFIAKILNGCTATPDMPVASPDAPAATSDTPAVTPNIPIADDIAALKTALTDFYVYCSTKAETDEDLADAITKTASVAVAVALYSYNNADPSGFNLYKSTDGVNFKPLLVDGFENKYNYGGRVILATKYGTYVTTANPFDGGQVWRIEDLGPIMTLNVPQNITLKQGETKKFSVMAVDLPEDAVIEMATNQYGNDLVTVELVKRETSSIITDYRYDVKIVPAADAYGLKKYVSSPDSVEHAVQMYDIVITGVAQGKGEIAFDLSEKSGIVSGLKVDITVEPAATTTYILGDAEGDGDVDVSDATYMQKVLAKIVTASAGFELAADVNMDGNVTINDVTAIQKYLANFTNPELALIGTEMIG
ncbi:MAG: dockerin type I repeat-containing protein [Oscillospiraceae bacterium]|jgi:hypothetical protein|nr:dockerin type I repeat-containing protein [Oscillospiraceae bacterium]